MKKSEQSLWYLWHTIKRVNIFIMGVPEKIVSKETITENFPCLMKDMNLHMQEIQRTPSQRSTLRHTIIKLSRDKDKET